jgi:uncharacterized protein YfaS (alpha-2-macroglobulin family)
VLRQGLPSAVGESLLKSADYEIYVRDHSPQAHFAGRAYVLPRQGQKGAPLVTVNTAKVSIDVYRVGDRNLLATVNRDVPQAHRLVAGGRDRLAGRSESVERDDGRRLRAQPGHRDRLSGARRGRQARARRLCHHRAPWKGAANPADSNADETVQLAAQWMVVSDLGLTAISGDDGVHALVQSLGSAAPLAGVELRLIAQQ